MPHLQLQAGRTYFRLEGAPGLPMLALLHPIGSDHSLWDAVVPSLLASHQVLRPDLRGHGGSSTGDGDCTLDGLAGEFIELCERLDIDALHLCGISLGGFVASAVAARKPALVRSLVLCSTAVKLPPPPGGWDGRAAAVREQGLAFLADGMVQRMVSAEHLATQDPAVATLKTVFLHTEPEGYAAACAVLGQADLSRVLPEVKAPTLVITGDKDALMPAGTGLTMTGHLQHGEHLGLPCGHFPPLEAPATLAQELLRWSGRHAIAP